MKTTKHKKIKLTTTLKLLREHGACESGYKKLRKHVGVKWPDDKPINLMVILKNNGVQDMLWCVRATEQPYADHWQFMCKMYADFAESVLPVFEREVPGDNRPRLAIEAARGVTSETAVAAGRAAEAAVAAGRAAEAAGAAGRAAGEAAEAAGAAGRAAVAAGRAAGWAAGRAAGWAAGRAAGWAAGRAAEEKKQAAIIKRYLR